MAMGQNELTLVALFVLPVVVLLLLRANATFVFLSLCVGYVLSAFLGNEVQTFADLFVGNTNVSSNVLKLGLLLAPAILTAVFMVHSVKGTKATFNILPAIAVGCVTVLFAVPLLTPGMSHAIMSLSLWQQVVRLQSLAIGVSAIVCLLLLWTQRHKSVKEKKGSKHSD